VLRPKKILPSQPFHLVSWAAVSILEFFSRYAGTDTKIKWPNDLYWKDRKAGGILIETQIASNEAGTSEWNWAVIGIGININQTEFPPSLNNPVSLRQITGKTFDPVALARELCTVLDEKYQLINHAGFASIYEGYNANLYGLNKTQRFKQDNRVFEAIVKGVSPEGKLLLEHSFGEEFGFHDLEWLERG
jgi:BirA family biotin operon repressor/biotin-[acetyl-CoA-carboxylase] ligase